MTKVFIFHGAHGNPMRNWFPWLKEELEKMGCEVFTPIFPTPEGQSLGAWLEAFKPFEQYLDENTTFVGHSLGANFILNLLERLDKKIKAAFLVSGFVSAVHDPSNKFNIINKSFYDKDFNWNKIKENSGYIYIINSDNDPYVTIELAEEISRPLGVTLTVIEKAGHFNEESGYKQFPALLDMIEEVITASQ